MLNFKQFVNQQLKEQSELEEDLSENILSGLFKLGTKLGTKKVKAPSVRDRVADALEKTKYDDWAANFGKGVDDYEKAAKGLSAFEARKAAEQQTAASRTLLKAKDTKNVSPGQQLKPGKKMSSIPTPTGSIAGKGSMVGNVARGAGKFALGLTAFAPDEMASGELSPEMRQFRDIEKTQPSNVRVGKGHPGEKTIYTHADNVSMPKNISDDARAKRKLEMPRDNSWQGKLRRMQSQSKSETILPSFSLEISPEETAKRDAARQKLSDAAKAQRKIDALPGSELMVNPTTGVAKPIAVQSKLANARYDRSAKEMEKSWKAIKDITAAKAKRLSKINQDNEVKARRESTPQVQPKSGNKPSWWE